MTAFENTHIQDVKEEFISFYFIYSFNKHLLNTYSMSGTKLWFMELIF